MFSTGRQSRSTPKDTKSNQTRICSRPIHKSFANAVVNDPSTPSCSRRRQGNKHTKRQCFRNCTRDRNAVTNNDPKLMMKSPLKISSHILAVALFTLLMTPIQPLLVASASQFSPLTAPPQRRTDHTPFVPFGFQSGELSSSQTTSDSSSSHGTNDDAYAGSIVIDNLNGVVYLTGGTYGSSFDSAEQLKSSDEKFHSDQSECFVSVLKLPTTSNNEQQLLYTRRFGTEGNVEVCSAVNYLEAPTQAEGLRKIVSIGHTAGEGGLFTSLRRAGSDVATVYGFLMDLDIDLSADSENGANTDSLNGGMLFHENKVQYPVAFVSSPHESQNNDGSAAFPDVYVLMMESDSDALNPDFTNDNNDTPHLHPDLTAGGGGGVQKYGAGFDMTIKKLSWKDAATLNSESASSEGLKRMLKEDWSRTYTPKNEEDVFAASLLYVRESDPEQDVLLVAGSTRGSGVEFGDDSSENMDGFITKFVLSETGTPSLFSTTSSRLQSSSSDDMFVSAMCASTSGNIQEVYVIGSTTEVKETTSILRAFITKVDLKTLSTSWTRELGAINDAGDVLGNGCAVTSDGKEVFLAGTVKNNAVIDLSEEKGLSKQQSSGGDDIFIVKLITDNGDITFAKQIGSGEDESLARGGNGGGIVTDLDGNAILMGTTRGNFMRHREAKDNAVTDRSANVFIMSVSREKGEFLTPKDSNHHKGKSKLSGFKISLLLVVIIAFVCFTFLLTKDKCKQILHRNHWKEDGGADVSQYLDDFGDVDVEIRHSATGGFHGMYDFSDTGDGSGTGGYNDAPPDEVTVSLSLISPTDSRLNASIVKESLFLEDDDDVVLTSGGNDDDDDDDDDEEETHSLPENERPVKRHGELRGRMKKTKSAGNYSELVSSYDEAMLERQPSQDNIGESSPKDMPGRGKKTAKESKYDKIAQDDDNEVL